MLAPSPTQSQIPHTKFCSNSLGEDWQFILVQCAHRTIRRIGLIVLLISKAQSIHEINNLKNKDLNSTGDY